MSNPKILFLDEPTVGMDIQSRLVMWEMMKHIKEELGTTIFLTTHYLEEAEQLSDTVCIMKDGKEIVQGSPQELQNYLRQEVINITFINHSQTKDCLEMLEKTNQYSIIHKENNKLKIHVSKQEYELNNLTKWLLDNHFLFTGIEIMTPTLADIFLHVTTMKEVKEGSV
ncbi:MAG: hypothetical protein ACK5LC_02190 [Coprobacillaceae bacterium]